MMNCKMTIYLGEIFILGFNGYIYINHFHLGGGGGGMGVRFLDFVVPNMFPKLFPILTIWTMGFNVYALCAWLDFEVQSHNHNNKVWMKYFKIFYLPWIVRFCVLCKLPKLLFLCVTETTWDFVVEIWV
jgi:hypothetical protein